MRLKHFIASRTRIITMLVAVFLTVGLFITAGCSSSPVATTALGKIQGRTASNGVVVFKGIPYAAPPVGNLRFMPPQPAKAWSGTRQALNFGPAELQPNNVITGSSRFPQSENCLTLNVWAPKLDESKRPVMVWIHGGGFRNGSGRDPIYDGANLAKRGDLDVVTLNYRLGPFGFLYLGGIGGPQYAQSGNLGLLDQVAAIKWVRDNISSFGGDPGNVTVFGESAGSISVCTLLAMPAAKGLFRRAIAESGALNVEHNTANASATTGQFMKAAGVTDMAGLLALTPRQMLRAESSMTSANPKSEFLFGPVIDGVTLTEPPLHSVSAGSASKVDLLIGTNLDEIRLWTAANPALASLPLGVIAGSIPMVQQAISATSLGTADAVATSYKSRRPGATDGDVSMAVLTDVLFRIPSIRVAEAHLPGEPQTWMYLFTWPSPIVPRLGACHAIELPFVFGNLKAGRVSALIGRNPPQGLSNTMQDAWTAFARTGNPNSNGVPEWHNYDTSSRATMIFNTQSSEQNDPYGEDRQVWQGVPFDSVVPSL